VYNSTSIASIGVAAHEVGHAIQHYEGYLPIKLRNAIVPIANIGSTLSLPLIFLGILIDMSGLVTFGIIAFSLVAIFQIVTLPVELNASNRALATLESDQYLVDDEVRGAKKVLSAAALTYVAALIMSLAQLARLIMLYGRRNNND
ncbi:MAG: zinc metallopeptidase, partial [Oscillospiraceae bacterium]